MKRPVAFRLEGSTPPFTRDAVVRWGVKPGGRNFYYSNHKIDIPRFNWLRRMFGLPPLKPTRAHSWWTPPRFVVDHAGGVETAVRCKSLDEAWNRYDEFSQMWEVIKI